MPQHLNHPYTVDSPDWPCRHKPAAEPPPRLQAFLYRLLRDGASAPGDIEQIALDVAEHHNDAQFTNPWLATYAGSLVTYLLDENELPVPDADPDEPQTGV